MDEQDKDWGNVQFRRRARHAQGTPDDNAGARFAIGMGVFLVVALAYPWYSYWVQTHLLAHDLDVATRQLQAQADAEITRLNGQVQTRTERTRAMVNRRQIDAIRVRGATLNNGSPVVIVQLGDASLSEGRATICRQAASWLGQAMDGVSIRVQRHRGSAPAVDVGKVRC